MKKILLIAATLFCFINLIYAQAGRLDPSFGNHGIVTTDLGKNYPYPAKGKLVLTQPDGSSYLIFQTSNLDESLTQAAITKRHPDGSIDSSYGVNGFSASVKIYPTSAILQPDGKLVLGGYYDNLFYNYNIVVARFNANGRPDSTFDDDGVQSNLPFRSEGNNYTPKVTVLQDKGKIVVAGGFMLARYTANGKPDSTFGEEGKLEKDFIINGGAIQSDGKIVLAGYTDPSAGDPVLNIISRYKADGSADPTFGNNGKQTSSNLPEAVSVQADGKIVVAGAAIERYKTNGALDSSFSGDGIAATNFNVTYYSYQGYSLILQTNGKIVVAGNTGDDTNPVFTIARYNTNGSIDHTFSGDGKLTNKFEIGAVAIQKDNKIIVAGTDNSNLALARYNSTGTSDNTFGKNGKVTDSVHSGYTVFKSIATQKDGKKVVAGRTWNGKNFDFAVARYNTDGSLDKTFSNDGSQTTDFKSKDDFANSVAIQSDGKIVVVGSSGIFKYGYLLDSTNISIARYNTDGSRDNTFTTDPKLKNAFSETGDEANSVAIQGDGKIVIAGTVYDDGYSYEGNVFAVARLNADGSLDKTFDKDGKQTFVFADEDGSLQSGYATSVALQKDGKIVVAGKSANYYAFLSVARLNTNGSLDNTFSTDGKATAHGIDDQSYMSVAIQNDGKIVAGGYTFYRGENSNFITRFNTDGKLDSSFSGNGTEATGLEYNEYSPSNDFGNLVAIQPDGKIVVSGAAITRYNTNGSLDSTFGNSGIEATPVRENNRLVNAITISGNKLYAVGLAKSPGNLGLVARYLLGNNNTAPTVTFTAPANNATYLAPAAVIRLSAAASDSDGSITKVEFYSGTKLLHTETLAPYGYSWRNVPLGNYTLTAKAYDNSGNVTTSAPVHISVVPNKGPVVSIIKPANNQGYTTPAGIHFEAAAADTDGRITKVEFYNGSTLLRTEYKYPYTYNWIDVPAGTYTVTAVATDNWGAYTTSAPVTIIGTLESAIVSSKPSSENQKTALNDALSLKLSPNPTTNIVNIYTKNLQQDKPVTISIISVSGNVLKTMRISNSATQLDVSSLASGVYTIKIVSGDKVLYKQFVKL